MNELHEFILNYCNTKGFELAELTMIGIRDYSGVEIDIINDFLGFFNEDILFLAKGTTDPGTRFFISEKDRNPEGTFHLAEGFHKKIWSVGKHKGYEALVNDWRYCLPTSGWRDVNYNFKFDEFDILVRGYFGINYHRMAVGFLARLIGGYSSGCQVIHDSRDFDYILKTVKETELYEKHKEKAAFNYLLLNKNEIPAHLMLELGGAA